MNYQTKFSTEATKFFRRLDRHIQDRIKIKMREVTLDPFRFLEHYEGEGYKLRVGDYRMLIDVDMQRKILFVRVFDKRGRIYKR